MNVGCAEQSEAHQSRTMRLRHILMLAHLTCWYVRLHGKGSHIIMVKKDESAPLSVHDHSEVAKGTFRSLICVAGMTLIEFVASN